MQSLIREMFHSVSPISKIFTKKEKRNKIFPRVSLGKLNKWGKVHNETPPNIIYVSYLYNTSGNILLQV